MFGLLFRKLIILIKKPLAQINPENKFKFRMLSDFEQKHVTAFLKTDFNLYRLTSWLAKTWKFVFHLKVSLLVSIDGC